MPSSSAKFIFVEITTSFRRPLRFFSHQFHVKNNASELMARRGGLKHSFGIVFIAAGFHGLLLAAETLSHNTDCCSAFFFFFFGSLPVPKHHRETILACWLDVTDPHLLQLFPPHHLDPIAATKHFQEGY